MLWDVDHTLIAMGDLGPELYRRAFRAVTGGEDDPVSVESGLTDLDVMHRTLRAAGAEPTEASVSRLATELVRAYREASDDVAATARVLPGVPALLSRLAQVPGVHQGLLTGNLREVARIKLTALGLDSLLDLQASGYGGDHLERGRLVAIARHRAAIRTGSPYAADETVLVGDTPNDVRAGARAGVRVVAVATGAATADDLRAAGALDVIDDLTDTEHVARLILRRPFSLPPGAIPDRTE